MKKVYIVTFIFIAAGLTAWLSLRQKGQKANFLPADIINRTNMQITSSAFEPNQPIPAKFTCQGENINPPLQIKDIPPETKSLALIMHDPDAPRPGGFTHWVIYNIPSQTTDIPENSQPAGTQGSNGANQTLYTGPCPPSGTHRYYFYFYALDTALQFDQPATKDRLEQAMAGHIIAQAELMGTYKK